MVSVAPSISLKRAPLTPLRVLLVSVVYLVGWFGLNLSARAFEVAPPNIFVWHPSAGLTFILLLLFGVRFAPLVVLAGILDYAVTADPVLPFLAYLSAALVDCFVYGAATLIFLERLGADPRLPCLKDVLRFVGVTVGAAVVLGALQSANAAAHGAYTWDDYIFYAVMYAAGDANGVIALAPPLLLISRRVPGVWRRRVPKDADFLLAFKSARERWEIVAEVGAAILVAYIAFGLPASITMDYTYLLVLPCMWAAMRYGFAHATWVVLALNVAVAAITQGAIAELNGLALQLGLVTVTLLGVLVGAYISERRHQTQGLKEAREQAEEAARLKQSMLMHMSHEIRTPLTGVLGFAQLIADETEGHLRDFAESIQDNGHRLLGMLTSMLELARLESGTMQLSREEVDVGDVVRGVLRECQPRAEAKGLELRSQLAEGDLGALLDPDALRSVLHHLVMNAVKFTEVGSVRVSAEADAHDLVVCVTDTGIGIPSALLPRVFEPFRQASEGLGRVHEGSGLGLTIVKVLVERMEGTVRVESEEGRGTTFEVRLPHGQHRASLVEHLTGREAF